MVCISYLSPAKDKSKIAFVVKHYRLKVSITLHLSRAATNLEGYGAPSHLVGPKNENAEFVSTYFGKLGTPGSN
jgi:hypothetical protein